LETVLKERDKLKIIRILAVAQFIILTLISLGWYLCAAYAQSLQSGGMP
jgi:hypothetical protein